MRIHGRVEAHYAELMENDLVVVYFHSITQTEKTLAEYWAENESNIDTRVVEFVYLSLFYLNKSYHMKLCFG